MTMKRVMNAVARRATLPCTRARLRSLVDGRPFTPPVGFADLGHLRRTTPLSRNWGEERGGPIDRHYIEQFLSANADDIRGRVLEIGDADQTRAYGGNR